MYIISKWRDYYDYLSHIYGQDKSIVYDRRPFHRPPPPEYSSSIKIEQKNLPQFPSKVIGISEFNNYDFKLVSICSKPFLLVKVAYTGNFTLYEKSKFPEALYKSLTKRHFFSKESYLTQLGKESSALLEVSKKLNAPVFSLETSYRNDAAYVDYNIPILSDLGNTIKPSPDTTVNDTMNSKEKIVSHGFDLKQSFRGKNK